MLTISINPIAFSIGSLQIRWYGIMIAMGVASLLVVMLREARKRGIQRDIYSIFFWCILGGIIGGRVGYVIWDWQHFVAHPLDIFGFEGLAQSGMLVGIVAAALVYMGVTRMRFSTLLTMGDAVAVGAPLALAIGRIGCTINGCCYGQSSPFNFFPLAVIYTRPNSLAPLDTPIYPTQIYHLLWNLIVFAMVWRLRGKFKPEGSLLFFFLSIFAIGDFALRFLRAEEPWVWGLRQAQFVDLAAVAIFLPWLIIKLRQSQKQALVAESATESGTEQSRGD
jgi:phosphatidylglycerol:prolipoprotein diacylglycerol transferase